MKAKRAGSGQSGKNLRCFIRASKANCDKALELLAGYRSFPPVGPTPIPPRTVITPASLLDLRGTCTTLVLDVEPIFLEPLSQEVTLGPITLDMHTVPKHEHLLGTTLCALARLQE